MKLKDLKPGDEVYMIVGRTWSNNIYKKFSIEKITPKGFIRVDGKLFDQRGNERKRGYHGVTIYPVTEETTKMVNDAIKDEEKKNKSRYLRQIDFSRLPVEVVEKIYDMVIENKELQAK